MAEPTPEEWEDLKVYVGAPSDETTAAFLEACWDEATELIDNHIAENEVPATIYLRCQIEVGADLYYRKASKNGIVGINSGDLTPVRINRDPMTPAYSLLAPFLPGGFS